MIIDQYILINAYNIFLAVPLTHANVLDKMRKMSFMTPGDVMLGFTNLDAISGIRFLIGGTLNIVARIVNQGPFTPERFFELVEKFKVTFTSLSIFLVYRLLKHSKIETADLSSIKMLRCGGATVPYSCILKMNEYLRGSKFCHSFGMTEMVGVVAINMYHSRNNCVGQLVDDCEAKIVNAQGVRLGVNESGELCLREPYLFNGYLGDDKNLSQCFDSEGFFKTGDIARFDENHDLFLIDRKKVLFKCLGEHVTPFELEEFLNQIDGVYWSCVVPVPDVDPQSKDLFPAAVIVKSENSTCTEESIYNAVSSKMNNLEYVITTEILFFNNFQIHSLRTNGCGEACTSLIWILFQ